jgi:hypothetical protein
MTYFFKFLKSILETIVIRISIFEQAPTDTE